MSNHQIRDLVHTIKSADLTPLQISQAFGEIYLSSDTLDNQLETQEIVEQFRSVKVPTLGTSIPNTTTIATCIGDAGIIPFFTPGTNKTYQLIASDVANSGSGSVTVVFGYTNGGDFVRINSISVASGGFGTFTTRNAYTFDSDVYPAILVTSGTAGDVLANLVYSELVQ